jgi:uncharacterized protein with beta-barrel porin domain
LLVASTLTVGASPAAAQDATWLATPGSGDFNTAANWNPATVPTGTALFGTSNTTALSFSADTTIGGWTFNAGASNYTFSNIGQMVQFNGAGIVVNGGSASLTTRFLNFFNASTAGSATITNQLYLIFNDNSTAGSASITNNFLTRFNGGTAGNANITNNAGADLEFMGGTAGNSTIVNTTFGTFRFFGTTTAGSATITNNGILSLSLISTLGRATITNNGSLDVADSTTAGSASITNNGFVGIRDGGTAGNATITNNAFVSFANTSTAGNAIVINNGTVSFGGDATAGNATITNNALVRFGNASMAGNATITNNGGLAFSDTSTAGTARLINGASGSIDLSLLTSAGMTAGSIEGGGSVRLGAKNLAVGGNNLSTTFSGVIQDGGTGGGIGGSLTKVGTGMQTLSGANTYTGGTSVNAGTLSVTGSIGSAGTPSGAIGVLAGTTLSVGATGAINIGANNLTNAGTVTVAAGGSITDDLVNSGVVNNAGSYIANVQNASPGVITNQVSGIWIGNVTSNTGTVTNMGNWIGTVNNSGTFNNNVAGAVSGLLTNNSGTTTNAGALNGGAVVNGGLLTVNGTAAAVTVNTGGTLSGNGIVGNTTINGGRLAPGNSIGLLTVQGSLVFTAASSYMVEVSPANADRTNVTGTATLGGATVNASFAAGTYAKQYTILNAAGGVSGTFAGPVYTNLPANIQTSLGYDANNAYLNLTAALGAQQGLSGNQQNVANAINGFFNGGGALPPGFVTLFGLTGSNLSSALTQLSGETATGSQQATFDAMGMFLGVMTDPFIAGRGDPVGGGGRPNAYADESMAYAANGKGRSKSERDAYGAVTTKAPPLQPTFEQRWSVWAAGYGGSQRTDGNAVVGSNDTRSNIAGGVVGADYRFSPNTIAGFALAGGGTNFSVNTLGSGRSDLFQAGAFVRHNVGPAYLTGALAYGWQDITTDRFVTVAGLDHLRAQFNANAFSGRVEGGYRLVAPYMGGIGVTPYAAGQFTTFDLPAYAEQAIVGANTFALAYGSKSVTDSRSELGMRADKSFAMASSILTLRGRAAWVHDFNPDRAVGATFQTLPGASFVVNGAARAADSALVTASAEVKWISGWSAAATFEGEFSNVTNSYAGKGVVRYAW